MSKIDRWLPEFYDELRRVAAAQLQQERVGHTLAPTALVHEAYLRLAKIEQMTFENEARVKAAFAGEMRRVLVDHARGRNAAKRGGGAARERLSVCLPAAPEQAVDLVALDDALEELKELDPRDAEIVQLHIFGGLSLKEMEPIVELSTKTIGLRLRFALSFLAKRLGEGDG